ncbi:hypothetical protein HOLleu_15545 [Holothuria leucospilota]|uniref:Transposase domain-containing protein n=1 Tax=Holothuria leucospilota TaxID=206669 RepID=A0A9Q1C4C3_HOLLE|nr:hypothetical protein HOLleu_15545 [Holothuria leucospilota]
MTAGIHEASQNIDSKLFDGCPLTVAESLAMILLFSLRHHLTGAGLADLLTLVSLHCALPNLCARSTFFFQKHFRHLKSPVVFHKYCSFCCHPTEGSINECKVCKRTLNDENVSYFIECPLITQLLTLFKREDFVSDLQHRFHRRKKNDSNYEDIYDGEMYKSHTTADGFLSDKNNISLMWYTDGVPLFKSSKYSMWPLYFTINELPFSQRMMKENMLFGGIWYGEAKPLFHLFLKPSIESLQKLYEGVDVILPDGETKKVRGFLLCGTCDLPAKALVLNMTQFNGKHGCARCLQSGQSIPTGRGTTWVYPFEINPRMRNHKEFVTDGKKAAEDGKTMNGVKGPSWLSLGMKTDVIRGTLIDYMHCVLLGVTRKLLHLWFDSSHSRHPYSLSRVLNQVDERLLAIKPPNFVTRTPRSIKLHCKYWKANECRAWLFFYSVPVLFGLMNDTYFSHYCLLVESIYILNMETISKDDIKRGRQLIEHFCFMFSTLYGPEHMTANMHQLLHLTECVRDFGPLWVFSCFKFEDMNGQIVQMFHGTKKPELQICTHLSTVLSIPLMLSKLSPGQAKDFALRMQGVKKAFSKSEKISTGTWRIGCMKTFQLSDCVRHCLQKESSSDFTKFQKFLRITKHGALFQSKQYLAVSRRNSHTIIYTHNITRLCGQIEYFMKCCCCNLDVCTDQCQPQYFAVVQMLPIIPCQLVNDDVTNCNIPHIFKVSTNVDEYEVVAIDNILSLCVFMPVSNMQAYISTAPNTCESD